DGDPEIWAVYRNRECGVAVCPARRLGFGRGNWVADAAVDLAMDDSGVPVLIVVQLPSGAVRYCSVGFCFEGQSRYGLGFGRYCTTAGVCSDEYTGRLTAQGAREKALLLVPADDQFVRTDWPSVERLLGVFHPEAPLVSPEHGPPWYVAY